LIGLDWIELNWKKKKKKKKKKGDDGGGEKEEEMENGCEWYRRVLGLLDFMGGEKGE